MMFLLLNYCPIIQLSKAFKHQVRTSQPWADEPAAQPESRVQWQNSQGETTPRHKYEHKHCEASQRWK